MIYITFHQVFTNLKYKILLKSRNAWWSTTGWLWLPHYQIFDDPLSNTTDPCWRKISCQFAPHMGSDWIDVWNIEEEVQITSFWTEDIPRTSSRIHICNLYPTQHRHRQTGHSCQFQHLRPQHQGLPASAPAGPCSTCQEWWSLEESCHHQWIFLSHF